MEQNNTNSADVRLLSVPEACERLGIGSWNMYQQINNRTIKTVKIGNRRLISTRALDEFIASMER